MQFLGVKFVGMIVAAATAFIGTIYAHRARAAFRRPPADSFPPVDPRRLASLFDGVAAGVIVTESDGRIMYVNPAASWLHGDDIRASGQPISEFDGMFEMVDVEGRRLEFADWPIPRLVAGRTVAGDELVVRRLDIDWMRRIRYSGARVMSDGGERIVLTMEDVTALRQVEQTLSESQIHLRQLVESLPQLVWTCRGEDGSCDYLSPQFVEYTGVPAEAQLGFGWLARVHPDDREGVIRAWRQAADAGRLFDEKFRIRRADGAYRWFKTRALPLRDARRVVVKWFGTNTDIHDERTAEESKSTLASIVEHSYDAIISKSLDGTIVSWNQAAERVFGYGADEMIGRNITILIPPDRLHEERMILSKIALGEKIEHFESQRVRKDGGLIDVGVTISPIRDAEGRVIGASKIVRDVTEANAQAKALRDSEARFRGLAAAMPQIVWTSSPEGGNTYLNDRWFECTGLPTTEQPDLAKVVHPDDTEQLARTWAAARQTGAPYEVEFRLRHVVGGPYRWFLARATPSRDANGRVIEWFGTSTDIDDLKQAESIARENAERLRGVLESAVDCIVTIDPAGVIESVNRAVTETFGYSAEELHGRNVDLLISDSFTSKLNHLVKTNQAGGDSRSVGGEGVGRRKDGSTFPIDLSITQVQWGGRKLFTGFIRDISARHAAESANRRAREREAELAHMNRVQTMGQMASGLAHELNQPLGAIANYAAACRRLLGSEKLSPERLAAALQDIQSEANRAGEIIKRLRGFVRKQTPQMGVVDANALVDDVLKLMDHDLRSAGVAVRLELAEPPPRVLADPVQISQVLVNLIRNAIDAMIETNSDGRIVMIKTAEVDNGVQIAVCDRGCGISREDAERIFDAFYTTKPGGLGVGLSLCRTIVEDHGGRLKAEPNPPNGTTFTFTLRRAEPLELNGWVP